MATLQNGIYGSFQKTGNDTWRSLVAGEVVCKEEDASEPTLETANYIYVGGSGASDTIVDGRGLISDLPFSTLSMAVSKTVRLDRSLYREFVIQDDIDDSVIDLSNAYNLYIRGINTQSNYNVMCRYCSLVRGSANLERINIKSKDTSTSTFEINNNGFVYAHTCNFLCDKLGVGVYAGGYFTATNCGFEMTNSGDWFLYAKNKGVISLVGNVSFNGTATSVIALNVLGTVYFNAGATISGECVGNKYAIHNGSKLLLNGVYQDSIPGTQAGVCDTSSEIIA